MGFLSILVMKYMFFTAAIFLVGKVMNYLFDEKKEHQPVLKQVEGEQENLSHKR